MKCWWNADGHISEIDVAVSMDISPVLRESALVYTTQGYIRALGTDVAYLGECPPICMEHEIIWISITRATYDILWSVIWIVFQYAHFMIEINNKSIFWNENMSMSILSIFHKLALYGLCASIVRPLFHQVISMIIQNSNCNFLTKWKSVKQILGN